MKPWIERCAGLLLHITSLPSGRLGPDSDRFIEIAVASGLRVWQLLPVGPTDRHRNPFQPPSAFAADTALLPADDPGDGVAYRRFCSRNEDWLDDWALFHALRRDMPDRCWWEWPRGLRERRPEALAAAMDRLHSAVEQEKHEQFAFATAWDHFRRQANDRGLLIFGDVPLFVAHHSADVWAHPELFEVDEAGQCQAVVGVPPDAFSEDGQLWGYPPYRWDRIAASDFAWWKRRFEVQSQRFDLVRLDHFRGFEAWWRVPASAATAAEGEWVPGPGAPALQAIRSVLRGGQMVAEDLGVITEEVIDLRLGLGIPGMRVLQFAFDGSTDNVHLPERHGPDSVCYTGTHDNDTTLGWWKKSSAQERAAVQRYLKTTEPRMPRDLVELAWASPAPLTIVPLQDLLGLDSDARMNRPGVAEGNWAWRFQWDQLPRDFAQRLHAQLQRHGRLTAGRLA